MKILCCFLLTALLPSVVHAELYGFVDPLGEVHVASEKLDERYQLFSRASLGSDAKVPAETTVTADRLEDHVIYKRLQKTPNVRKFDPLILKEAQRQKLEPALVKAVIAVESGYDPDAVSPKGASGLMQLIPDTAARYGVRQINDPQENVNGGTRYLRDLLNMFGGNLALALAGFNAGEGAVQRYKNTIPPYPETMAYVKLVMKFYDYFSGGARQIAQLKGGRIRITLPPRRGNLPAAGVAAPGLFPAALAGDGTSEGESRVQ